MKTLVVRPGLILVLGIFFITSGYPQSAETPLTLFSKGRMLADKQPERAYAIIGEAMRRSKESHDLRVYVASLNALSSLVFRDLEDKRNEVFTWVKEGVELTKDVKADSSLAELHFNVAEFYNADYEIDLPVLHYEKAIAIWESLPGVWQEQIANGYHGLGDIYKYNKGDFLLAEKSYEKALQIREKIKLDNIRVLTRNYYNLATTNNSQQDYEKALAYGIKTLQLARRLNDPIYLEMSNAMLAGIYRDKNDLQMARQYYLEAIELNKKTNDPGTLAWYYQGLGRTLMAASLYKEALTYYYKAYSLYKRHPTEDKLLYMDLLQLIAKAYSLQRDDKLFGITKDLFRELGALGMEHSRRASLAYITIGEYYESLTKYDSAVSNYQKALIASVKTFHSSRIEDNPTEDMDGFDNTFAILAIKAQALKRLYHQKNNSAYLGYALRCLILSEELLSKERNYLDMEDAKWQFLESNYDVYEDLLSVLFEARKISTADTLIQLAYRYFEQSKSRSLANALTSRERNLDISSQDSLIRRHADLKVRLFNIQDQLNQAIANATTDEATAKLRNEVVLLDRQIQDCKFSIEQKYPGYFNARYGFTMPQLSEIQTLLHNGNRVILEYFWGNESVYAIGITEKTVEFRRVGAADSLQSRVDELVAHFNAEHASTDINTFKRFISSSHALYSTLVKPFHPLLPATGRIQVIPDGSIAQVPFEILLSEKPDIGAVNYRALKYLIKDYIIGYAYSSTMIFHKRARMNRYPSLLAIGFTGGQRLRSSDPELEEIQGAEKELDALSRRFSKGKFLTGPDATESNFKSLAPQYDIIHLAIHGKGDVDKDLSASLYFRKKYDSLNDGELHAYELYALKFKASMAVLTSCESGLGKGYRGEGMISMANAFTYSGCENILLSLWKVNDQASIELMDNYYGYLLKGTTIDDALRLAKLDYLNSSDELSADPMVWAPVIAYGSLDPIFPENRSRVVVWSVVAVAATLLLIYFFKRRLRG